MQPFYSKVEPSSVTVTSARPSAEAASLPSDESLRKDIRIPAKNLTAEVEEPIATVVKAEDVKAEMESKLLNLPSRFTMVKSNEDRKRKFALLLNLLNLFNRLNLLPRFTKFAFFLNLFNLLNLPSRFTMV